MGWGILFWVDPFLPFMRAFLKDLVPAVGYLQLFSTYIVLAFLFSSCCSWIFVQDNLHLKLWSVLNATDFRLHQIVWGLTLICEQVHRYKCSWDVHVTAGLYFMHPHPLRFSSSLRLAAAAVFLSAWLCVWLPRIPLCIYRLLISPELQFALLPTACLSSIIC